MRIPVHILSPALTPRPQVLGHLDRFDFLRICYADRSLRSLLVGAASKNVWTLELEKMGLRVDDLHMPAASLAVFFDLIRLYVRAIWAENDACMVSVRAPLPADFDELTDNVLAVLRDPRLHQGRFLPLGGLPGLSVHKVSVACPGPSPLY